MAGPKILAVDPDTRFLESVVEPVLLPYGFQLLLTSNRDKALEMAAAERPCLLLLRFPLESTLQLLQDLAQADLRIPSVLILEHETKSIPVELVRLGVCDYVSHSFTSEEVLGIVCLVLKRHGHSPAPATLPEARVVLNRDKVSDQVAIALEEKVLYEKAETERERWAVLMDAVDSAVWVVDADFRLLAQNTAASEMLGWSSTEAVGRSVCDLMSSSHSVKDFCQLLSQAMETRRGVVFPLADSQGNRPLLLGTKDGHALAISGRAVPLAWDGRVVGAICTFGAVPAKSSDGLVRLEFANMASHLLRSPLSFIQAGIDLLLNGDLDVDEQGSVLHNMREQSQRMRDFIKDLLELARLETDSVDIYPEPVVLPPIIKRVLSLVQSEEANYRFSFTTPSEFPIVAADPGKLELILLALLHGAMNRCSSGGHIGVELETQAAEAIVSILDNGEVIPVKQLERIFSQFYPVDDDGNKMPSTYQIGLYAAKRLVELQNGRMWAESRPGKGTRFKFSLPFWG